MQSLGRECRGRWTPNPCCGILPLPSHPLRTREAWSRRAFGRPFSLGGAGQPPARFFRSECDERHLVSKRARGRPRGRAPAGREAPSGINPGATAGRTSRSERPHRVASRLVGARAEPVWDTRRDRGRPMTAEREIGASETFRNALLAMRCAGCDGPFTPKRKGQAHCRASCRKRALERRRAVVTTDPDDPGDQLGGLFE